MSKKIAVMGSGNGSNFQAIADFFQGSEVEIVCLSDQKDAKILQRAQTLGIENHYLPFEENENYFKQNRFDLGALAGYMRILTPETLKYCNFINIHPSLLPAFKGKNAIEQAFRYGVKVSGVTVHKVDETLDGGKILAQYPVTIDSTMNLAEFEEAVHSVEHSLYPLVIKNLLQDTVMNYEMLLKKNKGCGGCKGCSHGK